MRRVLMIVGMALAVQAAGGFLFAWSGLYNIGANKEHWPPVEWFFEMAMRRSVETHALLIDTPDLNDPALVQRGAAHYEDGCAPCHGAPDSTGSPSTASNTRACPPGRRSSATTSPGR